MKSSRPAITFAAFAVIALFLTRSTPAGTPPLCPDPQTGETQEDCPWAGIARQLQRELPGNPKAFGRLARPIAIELASDRRRTAWRELWGESINYDELAKGTIVDPAILAALARRFGFTTSLPDNRTHAGMEHTYGYLFSTLKTSFGFKRARWVQGEIDRGFGLPAGTFGPVPEQGTLFSNATYFFGKIVLRDLPAAIEVLDHDSANLPEELRSFHFDKLKTIRIEEQVKLADRTVTIKTTLVPFTSPVGMDSHLLIYSLLTEASGTKPRAKLITAFPVSAAFVAGLTDPKLVGQQPITTHYNAYVEGITGSTPVGLRKIIQ